MRVLVLGKYSPMGASTRYRMLQFFPYLSSHGIELNYQPLFDDSYLVRVYSKKSRFFNVFKCYIRRLQLILSLPSANLIWIEKELFPWLPWFLEKQFLKLLRAPYIVDYDDAIFHQYDLHRSIFVRKILGQKCDSVMRGAAACIVGNRYLADRAITAGAKNVKIVPTVVSGERFYPKSKDESDVVVIGWIGSLSTSGYLEKVRPVLAELAKTHKILLRVVGAQIDWEEFEVECIPWSEDSEVEWIQSFDIGIMPLADSSWERGKCGFKIIQYMACGKPVVADAVGANIDIVEDGVTGLLCANNEQWYRGLMAYVENKIERKIAGKRGRELFLETFSLLTKAPEILSLIKLEHDSSNIDSKNIK